MDPQTQESQLQELMQRVFLLRILQEKTLCFCQIFVRALLLSRKTSEFPKKLDSGAKKLQIIAFSLNPWHHSKTMTAEVKEPDTKLLLEELLGDDHCLIHVNPTVPGVLLPDHLRKEPTVSMKLSHYFAGRVVLREDKVEAELRFGSTPFACLIPYAAIWAATSVTGELTVWEKRALHSSLPRMLRDSMGTPPPAPAKKPKPSVALAAAPKLAPSVDSSEVDSNESSQETASNTTPLKEETGEKKRPSFLKRIK